MQDLLAEGRRLGVRSPRPYINPIVDDPYRKLCKSGCESCREYRNMVRAELAAEAARDKAWLDSRVRLADNYKAAFGVPLNYYLKKLEFYDVPVAKPIVAEPNEERFFDDVNWDGRLRVTSPSRNDPNIIGFDFMRRDEKYIAEKYLDLHREDVEALRNWLDAILRAK